MTASIRRKPKTAIAIVAVVALALGAAIPAGGVEQAKYDAQKQRADDAGAQIRDLRAQVDELKGSVASERSRADTAEEELKKATAKGEVPDLTGMDIGDVSGSDSVSTYEWHVKTTRQVSEQQPGTVIAQDPKEGTRLKAGRSIQLVVAKKAPPKPKQWVTINTLTGASSTKTDEFTIPDGATARLLYSMPQDGNNAITLYKRPNEYVDLLLNEIGPQSGSTRLYEPGTFYLDVTGAYSIQVQVFKRPA